MKVFIKSSVLTFFLLTACIHIKAQNTIYIQIAHNCADSTLDTLDLYLNDSLINANVLYHTATGMFTYPATDGFRIGVSYKHSGGIPDYIDTLSVPPMGNANANHRYVFIISGTNGSNFAANPDGEPIGASIQEVANVDSAVSDTTHVSLRFFGGATDLPAIDIKDLNTGQVYADSLVYTNSTTTAILLRHQVYELQVTDHNTHQNYGTFYSDLSGLTSQSVIVMCSGFLNQQANDSGPAFGLYALESGGGLLTLPLETSGFQLLHNSADTSLNAIDVYVNGYLLYKSLGFRNATPAILFNAHATYYIGIAPKNSTSASQAFWKDTFDFPKDTFFIATTTGLLNQTGYAANPDGISTAFNVLLREPAELEGSASDNFDFFMINGVTDAPPLNLVPTGGPLLLSNVDYAQQTNYVSLPSEFYTMNVQDTSGNTLVSGFANFLSFPGQSGVLLTSGFLNPASNNNGAAMGIYMVPITGGPFIPLFNATGIKEISAGSGLQVFPNPASGQLHAVFNLPQAEAVSLQITDVDGRLIKQVLNNTSLNSYQNIDISLADLPAGLYLCKLTTPAGLINTRFAVVK